MANVMSVFGERLLKAVLPQATAEADDYCYWDDQCKFCVTAPPGPHNAYKKRVRLCCTSQDGSYCDPWGSYGKCLVQSAC
jgi:hypothetical protein